MMVRRIFALLSLVALPAAAQGNGDAAKLRELDAYFAKAAKDWDVPGLAIGIVHKGQLLASGTQDELLASRSTCRRSRCMIRGRPAKSPSVT